MNFPATDIEYSMQDEIDRLKARIKELYEAHTRDPQSKEAGLALRSLFDAAREIDRDGMAAAHDRGVSR
jgi:hypothetical protein